MLDDFGGPPNQKPSKGQWPTDATSCPGCSFMAAIKNNLIPCLLYLNRIRLEAASG